MRVASFKVSNYRSIDSAEVELADLTCLVGPNNEGKSNLLRALGLGLNALLGADRRSPYPWESRRASVHDEILRYDPQTDHPVDKDAKFLTTITVRFKLSDAECEEFQSEVGHSLNGDLSAQVQFTARGASSIQYKKQRVGSQLTQKAEQIGDFLRARLAFQYVPPIRTADDAARVISSLVRTRLDALRSDTAYVEARTVLMRKTAEALSEVERDLQNVLPRFLPSVQSVHLEPEFRSPVGDLGFGIRGIQVDDGKATGLAAKGSGVQSLAALALLRHGAQSGGKQRSYILALEEPEAHLHSGALHRLRPLLDEIASEQQLIFSTHAGILVPTSESASTVVVRKNEAKTSRSLHEVRAALGVRLADNLQSARLVIAVEGADDVGFWHRVLPLASPVMRAALDAGTVVAEAAQGAANLGYQLQNIRRAACDVFVVYDSDPAGRAAVNRALEDRELIDSDYLLIATDGRTSAELEDLLRPEWLHQVVSDHLSISVPIQDGDQPWGVRLKSSLSVAGKSNSRTAIDRIKRSVWDRFPADVEAAILGLLHDPVTSELRC